MFTVMGHLLGNYHFNNKYCLDCLTVFWLCSPLPFHLWIDYSLQRHTEENIEMFTPLTVSILLHLKVSEAVCPNFSGHHLLHIACSKFYYEHSFPCVYLLHINARYFRYF